MFKIIKKAAWEELVKDIEKEIRDLESHIFVYEKVVSFELPMMDDKETMNGRLTRQEIYHLRLPSMKDDLKRKKRQLEILKGE